MKLLPKHPSQRGNTYQYITFEFCYDWSSMFKAFAEIPVNKDTHKALFTSWRESIIKRGTPYRYSYFYTNQKPVDTWWLHWLLDSITTEEKGHTWFRQQIIEWLENLPGDEGQLGGEYSILHLLTKDLTELKKAEGRGQKDQVRRGFKPLLTWSHQIKNLVGVLNPCSLRSRAPALESEFPSAFCLLPSAFLDKVSGKIPLS
jgi:hypothetical protein